MQITKAIGYVVLLTMLTGACSSQAQVPPADQQVAAAVKPLPAEKQEDATVKGYNEAGDLVTLRAGSNEILCLADDPTDDRFHVACYHQSLEPFMERGRELRAQGQGAAADSIRQAEIDAGELSMPDHPVSLYSLTGPADAYNAAADSVAGASPLYVIYTPFATADEVGLPTRPSGNMPWLMEPGKPWAHIMITSGN
jgi:hypothetical protein